jgi:hypothetical protein
MTEQVNQFGRKPGRGLRPWLLMPKIIGVAAYFGGVTAAAVLAWLHPVRDADEARRLGQIVRLVMVFAAVPGLLLAMACGVLLFLQHPGVFWATRWIRLKLALLLLGIPFFHIMTRDVVHSLRLAPDAALLDERMTRLRWLLSGAAVMVMLVMILGRHKPRLGKAVKTVLQQRQERPHP